MSQSLLRLLKVSGLVAGLAFGLGGCALLSTPDPIQTYRFGSPLADPPLQSGLSAKPVTIALQRINLPEASRGDRLLGVTGTEVAYISRARWISPAETLFDDSLRNAFEERGGAVRLVGGRDAGTSDQTLRLDVTTFEARYADPRQPPEVVITARARLTVLPDRTQHAEQTFRVVQPAAENRISSIVEAFDTAVGSLNAQVVAWAERPNMAP